MIKKYFRKNLFEYDNNKIIILSYDKRKLKKYIRKHHTSYCRDLSYVCIKYSKTVETYYVLYDFFNKNDIYRRLTLSFDVFVHYCSGKGSIKNIESF